MPCWCGGCFRCVLHECRTNEERALPHMSNKLTRCGEPMRAKPRPNRSGEPHVDRCPTRLRSPHSCVRAGGDFVCGNGAMQARHGARTGAHVDALRRHVRILRGGAADSRHDARFLGHQGRAVYAHNSAFHAKVGLFIIIGLLSVPPTLRYFRWRAALKTNAQFTPGIEEIKAAQRFIHLQAGLIVFLPLLAVLAAREIGISH